MSENPYFRLYEGPRDVEGTRKGLQDGLSMPEPRRRDGRECSERGHGLGLGGRQDCGEFHTKVIFFAFLAGCQADRG
jgi:hypothetical protein